MLQSNFNKKYFYSSKRIGHIIGNVWERGKTQIYVQQCKNKIQYKQTISQKQTIENSINFVPNLSKYCLEKIDFHIKLNISIMFQIFPKIFF